MQNAVELRKERADRLIKAMNGIKQDRPPLMLAGDMALVRYAKPETDFQYMIEQHEDMVDTVINEVMPLLPKVDFLAAVGNNSRCLGAAFLTKTLLPGIDLPADTMWALQFEDFMTEEDYDFIIDKGWEAFRTRTLFERLGYDPEVLADTRADSARCLQKYHDAGYPFIKGGILSSPFDILTFSRGNMNFYVDLYDIPEKVHEVMDIIMEEDEAFQRKVLSEQIEADRATGERTMVTVAPCVQANCDLVGRDLFEEFGWPLIERQTNFLLDMGCLVRFHMDANWTNNLDLFATFPKGQCIFDSDGSTDLEKTRDILGPVMGFTGTVHPATFSFGSPDEVYNKVKEQIETMGDSFIASPSCSIPANAPKENIDAMYAAIDEL